jgi:hypothetical protein
MEIKNKGKEMRAWAEGVTQMVEYLSSKYKALNSKLSITKK